MKLDPYQISQRIRWIMQQHKINQNQLAIHLQVTQPAVSKYLQGRIPPPIVLLRLAELAGTSVEWLLTGQLKTSKGKVSEKVGDYYTSSVLSHTIQSLPLDIQSKLSELITCLAQYLRDNPYY